MDGENSTIYPDGYTHARSIDSAHHPSRSHLKSSLLRLHTTFPKAFAYAEKMSMQSTVSGILLSNPISMSFHLMASDAYRGMTPKNMPISSDFCCSCFVSRKMGPTTHSRAME